MVLMQCFSMLLVIQVHLLIVSCSYLTHLFENQSSHYVEFKVIGKEGEQAILILPFASSNSVCWINQNQHFRYQNIWILRHIHHLRYTRAWSYPCKLQKQILRCSLALLAQCQPLSKRRFANLRWKLGQANLRQKNVFVAFGNPRWSATFPFHIQSLKDCPASFL